MPTGANNHAYSGIVPNMAITLDYVWDVLDPAERDRFVTALVARSGQFHPGTVGHALRNPENSHAIVYGPHAMMFASLTLYHHVPEAEQWMQDVLKYQETCFPGLGGDDGGWAQGFGYVHAH